MMPRCLLFLGIVLIGYGLSGAARADDRRESSVGMPARIDQLVLPGPELEVKPLEDRKLPVVLRIVAAYPHGSNFRYDLVYYGLDPGTFDLKDYLRRKDGSSTANLPNLRVTITALLPPGQIEPHALEMAGTPWLGGYGQLLVIVSAAWIVGLLGGIAWLVRGRLRKAKAQAAGAKPITLADRLRPLVGQAVAGKLTHSQCADLERSLLAYWRKRLQLEDTSPVQSIAFMRRHAEAGPLLEQLEIWLHRPGPPDNVNVAVLLEPYQNLLPEALSTGPST
jgi:hypothetical protein